MNNGAPAFLLKLVDKELKTAQETHGGFNSLHEGIAVLREEYIELEQEIFKKRANLHKVKEEALQVAAMGLKMYMYAKELEEKLNDKAES